MIVGFQITLFGSRIDLCLISTKSRVTRTFQKIEPPLFILARLTNSTVCPMAAIRCARMLDRTSWYSGVFGSRSRLAMMTAMLALRVLNTC